MPHNFTVVATSGALAAPALSFVNGLINWFVSYASVEMSFVAPGGGGTIGVNVLVAVCPVTSVTRYVTAVFVPSANGSVATKVTTPVAWLIDHVPSLLVNPVLQTVGVAGSIKQVAVAPVVASPVPVARPELPVMVVKVIVPPGSTDFVSGAAVGAVGGVTVGVIVESATRPNVSVAWYATTVATVPLKLGNGSNVTTPVTGSTVYVPSPAIVNVVALQFGTTDSSTDGVAGSLAPHNFTVVATNGKSAAPFVSLATGVYV